MYTLAPGHAVAGRLAPSARERPVLHQARRHRSGCGDLPSAMHQQREPTTAGAAASRPRACSRCRAGGSFGWDVTLESDDTFRRFYKLDNILLTDRVNKVFLTGLSDRNYFGAKLYHFGGCSRTDTQRVRKLDPPTRSSTTTTSFADPILGGELTWNTNALSFSAISDVTLNPFAEPQQDEPRRHRGELAPALHRSDRHHLHALRRSCAATSIRSTTSSDRPVRQLTIRG